MWYEPKRLIVAAAYVRTFFPFRITVSRIGDTHERAFWLIPGGISTVRKIIALAACLLGKFHRDEGKHARIVNSTRNYCMKNVIHDATNENLDDTFLLRTSTRKNRNNVLNGSYLNYLANGDFKFALLSRLTIVSSFHLHQCLETLNAANYLL